MEWKTKTLRGLGKLRSAGVNKLIDSHQKEVNLVNYMDVYKNHQISFAINFQRVTAKDSEIKNASLLKGDILFTPSSEKPTDIGHAGVIIEDLENTVYSYHLVRFRLSEPKLFDEKFLSYLLNTYDVEKHFVTRATGTTRYTLSLSDFYSLKIKYPSSKPEQIAIATILSSVDEAIDVTKQSIKVTEKLKKSLMQNLLSGKLNTNGAWRTEDEFYEDEKFGKVPIGWEVKKIKDLSTQVTDGEHTTPRRSDNGFYLLSARNIKHSHLDLSNVDYIDESELVRIQKRCNPEAGDILISCSGTIGNICIVPEGLKAGMVRSAALVKLKKELIEPEFVELVLQSFPLQLQMKKSVASSVQGNLFQGAIKKLKIAVPLDKEERISIIRSINNISINSKERQAKVKVLERLKKSLMQQLLTGKKRLSKETILYINQTL